MNETTPRTIEAPAALFGTDEDRKMANEGRAADRGLEPCATCGRGVRAGNGWVVTVTGGGGDILRPDIADSDEEMSDPGYMGAWVLGPECGKHVPRAYRTKWNGWDN